MSEASSIRILVISDYRDVHSSRPEAAIFLGLAERGFDITVMTYGDAAVVSAFRSAGIKVIDFHPEGRLNRAEIQRIRSTLIESKIDILHLFSSRGVLNGLKAARRLPVKVVLYRGYSQNVHWWDPVAYLKFLSPRADRIMCNAAGVAAHIRRNMLFGKHKLRVINKGHRLEWYASTRPTHLQDELGLAEGDLLFINVANNRRMKGIPYLLKAMTMMPADSRVHLLLVGRGMDIPKHQAILKGSRAQDHVHFLGFRDDALRVVAGADAFVLSSIKGESITKAVIEAMALGIPPIITDIEGNVELVEHEVSGLVVPSKSPVALRDAMERLANDLTLRRQLGSGARDHIATALHADRTIDGVETMYRELMS